MSRLWDRLCKAYDDGAPFDAESFVLFRKMFESEGGVVVEVSNIVQYFLEQECESWSYGDLPNAAPPWPCFFLEAQAPKDPALLEGAFRPMVEAFARRGISVSAERPVGWGMGVVSMEGDRGRQWLRNCFEIVDDDPEVERSFGKESLLAIMRKDGRWERMRWVVNSGLWIEYKKGRFSTLSGVILVVDAEGRPIVGIDAVSEDLIDVMQQCGERVSRSAAVEALGFFLQVFSYSLLLALPFLHCKNVERVEHAPEPGQQRKARKKQGFKQPLTRFYTLQIQPLQREVRRAQAEGASGLKRALHVVRGHFATYTPERPLLGHYVGTVFRSMHKRGSLKEGRVDKDYSV